MLWRLLPAFINRLETLAVWARLFQWPPDRCLTLVLPCPELAETWYAPATPHEPCRVIALRDGTFSAVPPDGAPSIPVRRSELALYRFDIDRLSCWLARNLQLEPACPPEPVCDRLWRIGDQIQTDKSGLPVFLALCESDAQLLAVVAQLASRQLPRYGLLIPTREPLTLVVQQLVATSHGIVQVLSEWLDPDATRSRPAVKQIPFAAPFIESSSQAEILSDGETTLLTALKLVAASHPDRRITSAALIRKAFGPGADYNGHKKVVARLKSRGMIASRVGRGGGVWLTAAGLVRARELVKQL